MRTPLLRVWSDTIILAGHAIHTCLWGLWHGDRGIPPAGENDPLSLKSHHLSLVSLNINIRRFCRITSRPTRCSPRRWTGSLEQFSKKWYQRRAFDVFRDATSLSANTALAVAPEEPGCRPNSTS